MECSSVFMGWGGWSARRPGAVRFPVGPVRLHSKARGAVRVADSLPKFVRPVPFIACGGRGCISVSANVAPKMMSDLVAAGLRGDFAVARELQVKLNKLHHLLFIESNPIPVKWALHLMKLFSPEIRSPLTQLVEPHASNLKAELTKLSLLER